MDSSKLKISKNNPRQINGDQFERLKQSIKEFPEMMRLRPIVYDPKTMEVLGGNMRLRAIRELNMKDIPDEWFVSADDLTDEQKREFVIKDNVGFGEWDYDILANEWDDRPLEDWGVDLIKGFDEIKATKDIPDKGVLEFAEELLLEHNYIILYFDNPMDWEVAMVKYKLPTVKSCDPAEKCQKIGIGRVVNGRDYL
jgi:ParB-like chromosome segregation protein Spo0J